MPAKSLQKLVQNQAYRIVMLQLLGVLTIALVGLVIGGVVSAYSVLSGGLTYVLPNFVFVWVVFRYVGARQMNMFVTAFFFGEMLKLFISSILFVIVVKYLSVSLLSVLIGLFGAMISFWVASIIVFSKRGVA